ncbi:MAG: ABC transporter ATP-binding protein [Actinomycetota bacterium]
MSGAPGESRASEESERRVSAADELPLASPSVVRGWVRDFVGRRRRKAVGVLVLLVITTAAFASIPGIIGVAVSTVTDGGDRGDLALLAAVMVAVTVVMMIGTYFGRNAAAEFGESILDELRLRVYDATVALPGSVVESVGTGELVARTTGDVETLAGATRNAIPVVLFTTLGAAGNVIAMAIVDVRLAAVAVITGTAVSALGVRWYLRTAAARYERERQTESSRSGALLERYSGRATLWAFGATGTSYQALAACGDERVASQLATAHARNRLRVSLRVGQGVALGVVVMLGAYFLRTGSLSAGAMTAATLYTLRLMDPVTALLEQLDSLQQAQASLRRIAGVVELSEANDRIAPWPEIDAPARRGGLEVRVENVTFGYEANLPALEQIDLTIPAGQRVMVVGPSGAGKSTLAGLICGTQLPWTGSVCVDDVDVGPIRRDELRARVALVAQETHTFERSIRDNVSIGRPAADDDEITECLQKTGAWSWIADLPDGLDTIVSNTHPAMTAARAQQLNLARVICLDPQVVVLDEATADLDLLSAGQAERQLGAILHDRTVVWIAHRLDNAPRLDRVIMIADGRIVDDGPHDQLIARDGPYGRLWDAWRAAHGGTSSRASDRTPTHSPDDQPA